MSSLAESLKTHRAAIEEYLCVRCADWDKLAERIAEQEARQAKPEHGFADEQVWTFLVGCGYAIAGEKGIGVLTKVLTGSEQTPATPKIWFEALPIPPREDEGNTHIDLALGTITNRGETKSGIELDNIESSWVCFCEMKWYADIALDVTHDIYRNQLARVIENALCFQRFERRYAEKVYVTLVTPGRFKSPCVRSQLYQYKFEEYETKPLTYLLNDLKACNLDERHQPDWSYPDLISRIESLSLQWASYDELFEQHLPDSDIKSELYMFWKRNKY
jgi:hypothetical protein